MDTGASISGMSFDVYNKLNNVELRKIQSVEIVAANKQALEILGEITCEISIPNYITVTYHLLVIKNLSEQVILGINFLDHSKAIVDFSDNNLSFNLSTSNKTISIHCKHAVLIKAKSKQLVEIIPSKTIPNWMEQGVVQCMTYITKQGMWFADTILQNKYPMQIEVTNYSNADVRLEANQKIGLWNSLFQKWETRLLLPYEKKSLSAMVHKIPTKTNRN